MVSSRTRPATLPSSLVAEAWTRLAPDMADAELEALVAGWLLAQMEAGATKYSPEQPRDDHGRFGEGDGGGGASASASTAALTLAMPLAEKEARLEALGVGASRVTGFSNTVKDAIMSYTGFPEADGEHPNSDVLNPYLRTGEVVAGTSTQLDKAAGIINRALLGQSLPVPMDVARVMNADLAATFASHVGGTFVDKGFVSTTIDPVALHTFREVTGMVDAHVVATIHLPVGSPGLYVDPISAQGGQGGEAEFLLPSSSRFRVNSASQGGVGKDWNVDLTYLDTGNSGAFKAARPHQHTSADASRFTWQPGEIEWHGSAVGDQALKYSPDQSRDDHGRFGEGGGGGGGSTDALPRFSAGTPPSLGEMSEAQATMSSLLHATRMDADDARTRVAATLASSLQGNAAFDAFAAEWASTNANYGHSPQFSSTSTTLEATAQLMQAWATTSADSDPVSVAVQLAAQAEFGLTGTSLSDLPPYAMADASRIHWSSSSQDGLQAFVRAEYTQTQAMLAQNGVTDVLAYRGMYFLPGKPTPGITSGGEGGQQVMATSHPLSSWSIDPRVAASFSGYYNRGNGYAIVAARIPAERIVSTSQTGSGCQSEGEVVVLGGTDPVWMVGGAGHSAADASVPLPNADWLAQQIAHTPPKATAKATGARLSLDADLDNADWMKKRWDQQLPTTAGGLDQLLRSHGTTPQAFMALPLFRENVGKHPWLASWAEAHSGTDTGTKYSPEQPRDDHGRFGEGSGDGGTPTVAHTIDEAIALLGQGKGIMFERPEQVVTLLHELNKIAQDAKAKGEKAPNYDLCNVSVAGTNLFCGDNVHLSRDQMPQLKGVPLPGSPADSLPKDSRGKVDLAPAFREYLAAQGHTIEDTTVPASQLRASQNQLDGVDTAGIMAAMEAGKTYPTPIFTSTDNYVVDGHHRWAATVGLSYEQGQDVPMKISRVDMPILQTLQAANQFATSMGIPPKSVGAGHKNTNAHLAPAEEALARLVLAVSLWEGGEGGIRVGGAKYSPDQPRDDHGRFGEGSGDGAGAGAAVLERPTLSPIPFIGVPASALPPGMQAGWDGPRQPSGGPVRGTAISATDPVIPPEVYHVTTNLPAVAESGILLARGAGGLEGDPHDQIVSLTIDAGIAQGLAHDMTTLATVAAAVGPEPPVSFGARDPATGHWVGADARAEWGQQVVSLLQDQATADGWHWSGAIEPGQFGEYSLGDWQAQYFAARESQHQGNNPIFFGATAAHWAAIPPDSIGVVTVPKANLDTGALVTNFDLGQNGLQEIRVYGDVPLVGATMTPATSGGKARPVTQIKYSPDQPRDEHGRFGEGGDGGGAGAAFAEDPRLAAISGLHDSVDRRILLGAEPGGVQWRTSLSASERDAFYAYTKDAAAMNVALRTGEWATTSETTTAMILSATGALERSTLPYDVNLLRTADPAMVPDFQHAVGQVVTDKGFVSTTVNSYTSAYDPPYVPGETPPTPLEVTIQAHAGQRGAAYIAPLSPYHTEGEVLFAPNSSFRVQSVSHAPDTEGRYHVTLSYLGADDALPPPSPMGKAVPAVSASEASRFHWQPDDLVFPHGQDAGSRHGAKYSPDQPRDEHGRFGSGGEGSGGSAAGAAPTLSLDMPLGEKQDALLASGQQGWQDGLSPREKQWIGDYTGLRLDTPKYMGAAGINPYLRSGQNTTAMTDAQLGERADAINGALLRNSLGVSMDVTRGFGSSMYTTLANHVGSTFTDKGIISTTINPYQAGAFGTIEATVHLPAGSPGGYVAQISHNPVESEYLLPSGSQFRVNSVSQGSDRWHYAADLTYLGPTATTGSKAARRDGHAQAAQTAPDRFVWQHDDIVWHPSSSASTRERDARPAGRATTSTSASGVKMTRLHTADDRAAYLAHLHAVTAIHAHDARKRFASLFRTERLHMRTALQGVGVPAGTPLSAEDVARLKARAWGVLASGKAAKRTVLLRLYQEAGGQIGNETLAALHTEMTQRRAASGGGLPVGEARRKYSPDQPRDDHGRFGEGDGGSSSGVSPILTGLHSQPGWDASLADQHANFAAGFDKYPDYAEGYTTATYLAAEQAHIDQMFATAGVWTRTSEQALAQALTDGRFKSAFETHSTSSIGSSHLSSYLSDRKGIEQTLFGYPPTLAASQRPLYGYASGDSNGAAGSPFLDAYGSVAVNFGTSLRDRTTVCSGDSGDDSGALQGSARFTPQPINAPDYRAFSSGTSPLNETLDGGYYYETQIHGGNVTPADVAEVVFHGSPPASATTAALDTAGIPYRTVAPSAAGKTKNTPNTAEGEGTPSILFEAADAPGLYILSASGTVGDMARGQVLDTVASRLYPPMSLVALLTRGGLDWVPSSPANETRLAGWLAQASRVPPPLEPSSVPPPPRPGTHRGVKYSPDQERDSGGRFASGGGGSDGDGGALHDALSAWFDYSTHEAMRLASLGESIADFRDSDTGRLLTASEQERITAMARLVQQAASTTNSGHTTLYRGVAFADEASLRAAYPQGQRITTTGLTATSPVQQVAAIYARNYADPGLEFGPEQAILTIQNPHGVIGANAPYSPDAENAYFPETVLPSGASYRVARTFQDSAGTWQVSLYSTEKLPPTHTGKAAIPVPGVPAPPPKKPVAVATPPPRLPVTTGTTLAYLQSLAATRVDHIDDTTEGEVSDLFDEAADEGVDIDAALAQMDNLYLDEIIPSRAGRIADTESALATNYGVLAAGTFVSVGMVPSGGGDAVLAAATTKTWVTMRDERVRKAHAAADGQEVGLADPFDVDGEDLMFPCDPDGAPGNTINCRCVLSVSLPDESDGSAGANAARAAALAGLLGTGAGDDAAQQALADAIDQSGATPEDVAHAYEEMARRWHAPIEIKYSSEQERDDHGRWSAGGGGGSSAAALPPGPTQAWQDAYHQAQADSQAGFAAAHHMTVPEYRAAVAAHLGKLLANAQPWIRIRAQGLAGVLETGHFMNAFERNIELGKEQGVTYMQPEGRAKTEQNTFGYSPDAPTITYPNYGYLSTAPSGNKDGVINNDRYGSVSVQLDRAAVEANTTVTACDTLNTTSMGNDPAVIPAPLTAPTADIFPITTDSLFPHDPIDPLTVKNVNSYQPYFEAQFHGGIPVSAISKVVFSRKADTHTYGLVYNLEQAGIPYTVKGGK